MIKKISLPVLVTVMCVMISVVLGLVWLNQQKQIKNLKTQKSETKITRTDYSATARKTLDWIDQQRNETGWYILERGCDFEAKTCDTVWDNPEGNKDGLIATWARLNYYHQTKDSKDLEIVKKDIDLFYEKYQGDNLKDSLWICKITYDMAQSGYLDDSQKEKLKELCFNTEYPSPEQVKSIWKGNKEDMIVKLKKDLRGETWKTWEGYAATIRGFDASLGYTTDLINKYLWGKDQNYLNLAKEQLAVFKDIFEVKDVGTSNVSKLVKYPEDVCLTMMSSLDLYEYGGKDINYLNWAVDIYNQTRGNILVETTYKTPICALVTQRLYQITQEQKYYDDGEYNNRLLVEMKMDGKNTKMTNDNGFFLADNKIEGTLLFKNLVENGLIVEAIRE